MSTVRTWNYYVVPAIVPSDICWRGGRWTLRHLSQPWTTCRRSGYTKCSSARASLRGRDSTSLTKRCCQQLLLPNPWKVRGDRLQDHGTGRRSFSSRASPRGVNGQRKINFINLMEDVIEACKRSHKATSVRPIRRRSPYVIGMRQRGPAHRAIYRRRTVLSQTPPQPTPNLNLATYRQSIWSQTLYPAFVGP